MLLKAALSSLVKTSPNSVSLLLGSQFTSGIQEQQHNQTFNKFNIYTQATPSILKYEEYFLCNFIFAPW